MFLFLTLYKFLFASTPLKGSPVNPEIFVKYTTCVTYQDSTMNPKRKSSDKLTLHAGAVNLLPFNLMIVSKPGNPKKRLNQKSGLI